MSFVINHSLSQLQGQSRGAWSIRQLSTVFFAIRCSIDHTPCSIPIRQHTAILGQLTLSFNKILHTRNTTSFSSRILLPCIRVTCHIRIDFLYNSFTSEKPEKPFWDYKSSSLSPLFSRHQYSIRPLSRSHDSQLFSKIYSVLQ